MKKLWYFEFLKVFVRALSLCIFFGSGLLAQQAPTVITDYVIFGGQPATGQTTPLSPGYAVQLGSSNNIQGGIIGSYNLVQTTGSITIGSNIYSGGILNFANGNTITGNLTAAKTTGTVVSIGSNASITGNIDANGSIVIGGGTVSGTITYPGPPFTYSGPGNAISGPRNIPTLPEMPLIKTFANIPSPLTNINNSQTIYPAGVNGSTGFFGDVTLGSNKKLTLAGTGVYVFKSIKNSGSASTFEFDFQGDNTGKIKIYVLGDVDLGKVNTNILNGGNESRIYLEAQGSGATSSDGTVAFNIANGSGGQGNASRWVGTVWAPYAAINIGSGTGSTIITGALWSGTQVNIQSGVSIVFVPFNFCETVTANAGAGQVKCQTAPSGPTSFTVTGTASSETNPLWTVFATTDGATAAIVTPGSLSTNVNVSGTGTVTLRLTATSTATPSCGSATSDVVLTVNALPTITGTLSVCVGSTTQLTGSAIAATANPWVSSNTSVATVSNDGLVTGIAAGTTTITYTNSNGCQKTATVTVNVLPTITGTLSVCAGSTTQLTGSATAATANPWVSSNTSVATVSNEGLVTGVAAGTTTITYTNNNGCQQTASVIVKSLPIANAGPDKAMEIFTHTKLKGTSPTAGATFSWVASNGGNITSGASTDEIIVSAAGTYTLSVTANGCTSTDEALVTSKTKTLIGAELQTVYETNPTSSPFFIITDGYIMIDIIVKIGNKDVVLDLLRTAEYGLRNEFTNGDQEEVIITGEYPIINLNKLNLLFEIINYCRPYYEPVNKVGLVNSAGDTTMRSHFVRNGYRLNGDGVKVGIISDSYATILSATTASLPLQPVTDPPNPIQQTFTTNTAAQDVTNGDLPGIGNPNGFSKPVVVVQDFPIKRSDEGRAMAQIVHDVAPGAEIFFRTGFFTAGDFAKGITQLKDLGCKVIVDDISYITEPFLKDGIVAKAVDAAKAAGVTYVSAAGNFANRSYEDDFRPVDASTLTGFAGKKAHNFSGTGDLFQHVRLTPGNYTIVFQWVDDIYSLGGVAVAGTKYDMDIYLTPNTDGTGLIGFNRDNTNGDPIEIMPFTISGTNPVDYNILIVNDTEGNNHPVRLKYIVYRGGIQIMEYNVGTSTLVGHGNAAGAIATGAARFNHVPGHPLLPVALSGITKPQLEPFSSIGGTKVFSNENPNGIIRYKPDLVGPDGVDVTVKLGQDYPNNALNGYPNFFGTSAAAPHVAGAAALIIQGKKNFLDQVPSLATPDELKSLLQTTAVDMDVTGFDFNTGYGLVDVDAAMRTFAAPTATLIEMIVPAGVIPCSAPFLLTITGENFSTNTVVHIGNTVVIPTFISTNEVQVQVSTCEGNPEIRAYTPPKAGTNGTDGGFSNSLYFFDASIVVNAIPITKKYGQTLPALQVEIKVDGVLLQNTNPLLTLADIGLENMNLITAAETNSNVGTYIITPSRIFDPNNEADAEFLVKYNYKFIPSTVTIEKMPLLVTPNDKTVTFGDHIGSITFNYEFNTANVQNAAALTNEIKNSHETFLASNALAVVKGGSVLNDADLANLNIISTLKAINNSRKFELEDNKLVPLTDPNSINVQYLVDIASESIIDYNLNPDVAKFYSGYPGYSKKALLGASALAQNEGKLDVNGTLVPMINGTLVPMINGAYLNGELVQLVNGVLVQLVNGTTDQYEPIPNAPLVQLVNGALVQLVNGQYQPIPNGALVQFVNGALVSMVNGSLVSMVNGALVQLVNGTTDQFEPIPNAPLVQLVNGALVQFVNGNLVPIVNGALVQLVNGSLVSMVNGNLQQLVNGTTDQFEAVTNAQLVQFVNASLVSIVNNQVTLINGASLVQLVNGSLVPMINGSLVQILNGRMVQIVNNKIEPVTNAPLVQLVNGKLVQFVNGALVPIVNQALVQLVNGSLVSMVNGSLVSMVNGSMVQLVNGTTDQYEPIANAPLVQLVNGSLVQFVNGQYVPVSNNSLVQLVNGSLVSMVNGSLVSIVNGLPEPITNAQLIQIVNGSLVSMVNGLVSIVNGSLVQLVNASLVPIVNRSLVQIVNGSLVQYVNASLVPIVNGSLVSMVNGSLVQYVNGQYESIANGSLVQFVNAVSLVQLVNGSLVPIVNSGSIGADGQNNNTAVIIDENDVDPATNNWLGPMAGINMITGLDAGVQTLVPGVLVNPNFDITYGLSKVTIEAATVVITPTANQNKTYGNPDPVFTFTNNSGLDATAFTGALGRAPGNNVGTYSYTLGDLSAGPNYILVLSTENPVATFKINPRSITITPNPGQTKVYGSSDPVFTYTGSEQLQNGDSYSGLLGRVAGESVTSSPYNYLIGTLSAGNNYTLTLGGTNQFTITKASLTVTANNKSKIYGAATPVLNYTASGTLFFGDSYNVITGVNLSTANGAAANVGSHPIVATGGIAANYNILHVNGILTVNKAALTVTADNKTRLYGENNPPLTASYSGFVLGENLQTSGITGTPLLSTNANPTSSVSPPTIPITISNGTLASSNYSFSFVNGAMTILNNECLLTHSAFKNFGNTPGGPTSLWMNMETKISGQLTAHGDYLLFRASTIEFNAINWTPELNALRIPDGKIVADNSVSSPITSYDAAKHIWITKVPLGFSSTSDVFVTGAIINSSTGFTKGNGNTSTVLKGIFYSNKSYSDQWAYGIAAYQPTFTYAAIAQPGQVVSINGTYRAGTPLPVIQYLVSGGSGGGGNNYSGSSSSFDNYSACILADPSIVSRVNNSNLPQTESSNIPNENDVQIFPNPASGIIKLSFIPAQTGRSKMVLYTIDGKKVMEADYGLCEKGIRYQKNIDVNKLTGGVYFIQLWSAEKITTKKIIIKKPY